MAVLKVKPPVPKARRSINLVKGAINKTSLRRSFKVTRVTFSGRVEGILTLRLRPYQIDDEYLTPDQFADESFEEVSLGTVDLTSGKFTRIFEGEFSGLLIDDEAYSGSIDTLRVEIHQTN